MWVFYWIRDLPSSLAKSAMRFRRCCTIEKFTLTDEEIERQARAYQRMLRNQTRCVNCTDWGCAARRTMEEVK